MVCTRCGKETERNEICKKCLDHKDAVKIYSTKALMNFYKTLHMGDVAF